MKRFSLILLILTAVFMLAAVVMKLVGAPLLAAMPMALMPIVVLYFALMDYVQYRFIVRAMEEKSARDFIKVFLGCTVASTFIHLAVIVTCVLVYTGIAKSFTVSFLVLYVVFTVYLIGALVAYVHKAQKK